MAPFAKTSAYSLRRGGQRAIALIRPVSADSPQSLLVSKGTSHLLKALQSDPTQWILRSDEGRGGQLD